MDQGNKPLRRVLVFDSGVGGLSIVQALSQRLAAFDLVYVADNALFPYGDLPERTVIERCSWLVGALVQQHRPDVVVIGCNTASTVVLPALRANLSVPVVGVVPAIKPAAALTRNHQVGLLATPATIRRSYLDGLIAEFASHCHITRLGSSELVCLAEQTLCGQTLSMDALVPILAPLAAAKVDTVVLGCTHFPLIRAELGLALPDVQHWVDSGGAIARRVEHLLGAVSGLAGIVDGLGRALGYFSAEVPVGVADFLQSCGFDPALDMMANWSP